MKVIVIFYIILSVSMNLFSQTGAIKIGPSAFYNRESQVLEFGGGVSFEYRIGKLFSFAGIVDYTFGNGTDSKLIGTKFFSSNFKSSTVYFRPELRYYPKEAFKGFFLGAGFAVGSYKSGYLSYGSVSTPPILLYGNDTLISPTILLGINLLASKNICFEINGGVGIIGEDPSIAVPIGIKIGYAF